MFQGARKFFDEVDYCVSFWKEKITAIYYFDTHYLINNFTYYDVCMNSDKFCEIKFSTMVIFNSLIDFS